jgi:hypothetical protein
MYVRSEGARPPLAAKYNGLFLVVAKAAKIQKGSRMESVTLDRLKPHLGTGLLAPALPSARGWPRKVAQTGQGHPPELRPRSAGRGLGGLERRINLQMYYEEIHQSLI